MKPLAFRRRAAVVAVALACALAACSGERRPVAELLQQARTLHAGGQNKAAIVQLKNVLLAEPENLDARTLAAALYAETREHRASEIEYRRALEQRPDSVELTAGVVRALLKQEDATKAIEELDAFRHAHGKLAPLLLALQGDARLGAGEDKRDARASYEAALAAAPGLPEAQLGLARLAAADRRTDEALRLVDDAIARAPRNVDALLLRGDVLHATSKIDEAERAYRRAHDIRPDDPQARLRLAALYIRADRLDAARAEIAAVRALEPQNVAAEYYQAALHMKEGDYVRARDAIQLVRARAPNHLAALQIAGAAAFHNDAVEQAERDLTSYLVRAPEDAYARKLLAANSLRANNPDKALATLAPLLKDSSDAHVYAIAGEAALRGRRFDQAEAYLQKAAALAPGNAGVRALLGVSRLAYGDGGAGMADLASAAALSDGSLRTERLLVFAHLDRGEHAQALAAVARLERRSPGDPAVHHLKAQALLVGGDAKAARASLERAVALKADHLPSIEALAGLDVRDGRLDAAAARFRVLLDGEPRSVAAMIGLAKVAAAARDEAGQRRWLGQAIAAAPADLEPRRLLTQHHLERSNYRDALAAAREAYAAAPENAEALALLASTQFAAGEKEEAATTYHALVKAVPGSVAANLSLARVYIDLHQHAAARDALERVLDLRRDHPEAQVALAMLELQGGRHGAALRIAQRMREQSPRSALGAVLEGDVRMDRRDYAAAAVAYRAAVALAPTAENFLKAHAALLRAGRQPEAEAVAEQWLKALPADNAARLYLAALALDAKREGAAAAHYEALLRQEPHNHVALNNLAGIYDRADDARALPLAEEAARVRPDDAHVADTLGWILVRRGATARGIEVLERGARLAAPPPVLHYHLAAAYARGGDKARARQALDRLLASDERFEERAEAVALRRSL